jgi:pSer/pThr/pTyr-binding forkhead associated (FHA) protein
MIRCSECGHENMDGLEYCDGCGAKLPVTTEAAVDTAPAAPTPVEVTTPSAPESGAAAETTATVPAEETVAQAPVSAPATPASVAVAIENAKLTVTRGGAVGKVFPLQAGDNLIGRWDPDSGAFPEVDLETDDPEARISRKHALVRVSDKVTIEDIGSLNGTYVNRGPRLEPGSPVALKDGDEIIIGKTFFKISLS